MKRKLVKSFAVLRTVGMLAIVLTFGLALAGCDDGSTDNGSSGPGKTYEIGEQGPAGGFIFYDKDDFSDGWRYLEAAPEDQGSAAWGAGNAVPGTAVAVGAGKENTRLIVEQYPAGSYAANLCTNYRGGGKDDWFLPSEYEFDFMYSNLKQQGRGNFATVETVYWSSYQHGANNPTLINFLNGGKGRYVESQSHSVRAARAF
jgi:hypothetical protein